MDPTLILLVVVLGAFILFQVFQGRKRRRETEERRSNFVPGVEIMTNYGLYGTILSVDDERNLVTIESTPGTVLKIHKQTILKVADYDDLAKAAAAANADDADADTVDSDTVDDDRTTAPQLNTDSAIRMDDGSDEPRYGERLDDAPSSTRPAEKKADE